MFIAIKNGLRNINKLIDKDQKRYNIFVFLSTFARQLIELFIPVILYKAWFPLKDIAFYYFGICLSSIILSPIIFKVIRRFGYKTVLISWVVAFVLLQISLANIYFSLWYLLLVSFLFSTYRRCYWIVRRFYNLHVIPDNNISISYSFVSIFNQVWSILSAYIWALLLDFVSVKVLTIISVLLFLISIYPISQIKLGKVVNTDKKLDLMWTLKSIKFSDKYIFASYELMNAIRFFIPLYLVIYVKDTYQIVWILQVITWLATIIFSYLYGKRINKDNVNYLGLSIFFLLLVYFLKVNVWWIVLALVAFMEWFANKMNDISTNKEIIKLSKNFDYENYNYAYEWLMNILRLFASIVIFFFIDDLKLMIYFLLFVIALSIPLTFIWRKSNNN